MRQYTYKHAIKAQKGDTPLRRLCMDSSIVRTSYAADHWSCEHTYDAWSCHIIRVPRNLFFSQSKGKPVQTYKLVPDQIITGGKSGGTHICCRNDESSFLFIAGQQYRPQYLENVKADVAALAHVWMKARGLKLHDWRIERVLSGELDAHFVIHALKNCSLWRLDGAFPFHDVVFFRKC